jgi:hypothetical protein
MVPIVSERVAAISWTDWILTAEAASECRERSRLIMASVTSCVSDVSVTVRDMEKTT